MNKRILALAQQANRNLDGAIPHGFAENFYELIVQECISVLDKEVYLATREDGEQAHIDVVLLEHFGITE